MAATDMKIGKGGVLGVCNTSSMYLKNTLEAV